MFRFMGFIWDVSNRQQSDAAESLTRRLLTLSSQWRESVTTSGLRVFHAGELNGSLKPNLLANNSGVVLGALFERNHDHEDATPARKALLTEQQSREIVHSQGRSLISNFWGNYVAFITDPAANRKWVIKDPTGDLPCYSTSFRDVTIFFSNINDCVSTDMQFTMNRSYLNAYVVDASTQGHNALDEVFQVHRGECIEINTEYSHAIPKRAFYWTPLSFPKSADFIEDPRNAAWSMRASIRSCTHTLASCHDRLALRLSGGLDSSIIAGCLKDTPTKPRITCYTYYNPKGRSDERSWARLAAQHSAYDQIECAVTAADIHLADALSMPPSVDPTSVLGYVQRSGLEKQLTTDWSATAVFTGDGGDSGFCSDSLIHAATEYLRHHGPRPEIVRLASQVAVLVELSAWALLARSLRTWLLGHESRGQREATIMTSKLIESSIVDAFAGSESNVHPWFRSAKRVPGGLTRRLGMLMANSDFYNVAAELEHSPPEIVSPLYSQPVIELLLRIPIHTHFEDGRDRGLARRAFVEDVPEAILQRLWKDRAPGFHDELIHLNLNFLRELLLDGVLVKERLLNRTAVEQALSKTPNKSKVFPAEILNHVSTEIWARHWIRT